MKMAEKISKEKNWKMSFKNTVFLCIGLLFVCCGPSNRVKNESINWINFWDHLNN
jgi:hypothetical protein